MTDGGQKLVQTLQELLTVLASGTPGKGEEGMGGQGKINRDTQAPPLSTSDGPYRKGGLHVYNVCTHAYKKTYLSKRALDFMINLMRNSAAYKAKSHSQLSWLGTAHTQGDNVHLEMNILKIQDFEL